jgi:hypothetical protein
MSSRPPFEFNLSAAADKKRKKTGRRGMSGAFETADKACDYPGCKEKAAFRAPKSPDLLDEFFWFCKDHIREYNLKWNFFQGTSGRGVPEVPGQGPGLGAGDQAFQPDRGRQRLGAAGGERPDGAVGREGDAEPGKPASTATRKLPPTERKAIEILDARDTWTKTEIRKQYKIWSRTCIPT